MLACFSKLAETILSKTQGQNELWRVVPIQSTRGRCMCKQNWDYDEIMSRRTSLRGGAKFLAPQLTTPSLFHEISVQRAKDKMPQLLPAGIEDARHLSRRHRRREANLGRRKEGRPFSQKESSALGKTHPSHIKHEPDKTTNPQSPINCLLKRKAMRL